MQQLSSASLEFIRNGSDRSVVSLKDLFREKNKISGKSILLIILLVVIIVMVGLMVGYFFRDDLKKDEDDMNIEIGERLSYLRGGVGNGVGGGDDNKKSEGSGQVEKGVRVEKEERRGELIVDGEATFFDDHFVDDSGYEMGRNEGMKY